MPRLFTGLEIPSDIAADLAMLRGGVAGARWIDIENYHITLRFIGDIDDRMAGEAAAILDEIERPSFTGDAGGPELVRRDGQAARHRRQGEADRPAG